MKYRDFKFYDVYWEQALKYEGDERLEFLMALMQLATGGCIENCPKDICEMAFQTFKKIISMR